MRRTTLLALATAALLVAIPLDASAQAPSALQATVSGNLLTLAWVAPSTPPSGYLLEAGTASGLADLGSVALPASPTSITAPVPNGTYFIRVRAIHQGVPSLPSNEVAVTVGCTGPPAPPSGFAVTQGAGGNPVHFSWTPPAGSVTGYRLEAGSGPGLANLAAVTLAASPTVLDVQAPPGTYYVRIRALNACGASVPSPEVVVVVGSSCVAPAAPQLAASVSGQTLTLNWSPPATGTAPFSYTLLVGSTSGASNLATVPMGGATSVSAPVPNGTYFLQVVATNACGVGAPSNEAVAQVGAAGVPLLTFSVTPNPVPYTYFGLGCAGTQVPGKTWVYTLRMTNQGTAPFVISPALGFSAHVTSPLVPPYDAPYPAIAFALAFGGSTIAPQASLQGLLCVIGNWEDATLQWTFNHAGGGSFTTPVISFLRP